MIDESPRQMIYNAIDRECEYKKYDGGLILNDWIREIEGEFLDVKLSAPWQEKDKVQCNLLKLAATVIACLEQHGIIEQKCEHEWRMNGIMLEVFSGIISPISYVNKLMGGKRCVTVGCSLCNVRGFIRNPTEQEWELAKKGFTVPWFDSSRVMIAG